ncbi:MAG: bacillithiol biosynthesis cysteine-adding enzyme BshC [Flavobacteriaceae bacterium]|nr:bacillithiol biosynthesis cysteine-adding enzyme BshC [Flavobacteriaceae bacterium]
MPSHSISFRETGYFSSLMCDYLDQKDELNAFYNRFPTLENFQKQIDEKAEHVASVNRAVLENALLKQYEGVDASLETHNNIIALRKSDTFTVTTGHQLNLFTGPLYFLYKIISTINLTRQLKERYPKYHFVPVYWMATEDHDFDEINFFNFRGKKVQWTRESSGAVGRLSTESLEALLKVFSNQLPRSVKADELIELFDQAYLSDYSLAEATRQLTNALFGEYGLVIIDGDDKDLKHIFIPYAEKELVGNQSFKAVSETNSELASSGYKIQVNPREINLFYLVDGLRERIVEKDGQFIVNNTKLSWDRERIITELHAYPERFSPNVITRPLYQEVILPNLCYIGGGGELAYWMQLKDYFVDAKVAFPILLLRNSVLLIPSKIMEKLEKLKLDVKALFQNQNQLVEQLTRLNSEIEIDFSRQKEFLKQQFEELHNLAEQTDKSFKGAVAAQERKQIKGLEHLEKRLLKAQKKQLSGYLKRVKAIQDELFPNQSLQERQLNFTEVYLELGKELINLLADNLEPLNGEFLIIET